MTPQEEIKELRLRIEQLEREIQDLQMRQYTIIPHQYYDPYNRPYPVPYWPTVTFGTGTSGLWQT